MRKLKLKKLLEMHDLGYLKKANDSLPKDDASSKLNYLSRAEQHMNDADEHARLASEQPDSAETHDKIAAALRELSDHYMTLAKQQPE